MLLTTVAMGFLGLTLRLLGRIGRRAGTWVAGLATSAWSVGSDELWQHSATMMWIAVSGYAIARSEVPPRRWPPPSRSWSAR